jgi:hypothetical protein
MVMLTRERVFAAAPMDERRRAELQELLSAYPDPYTAAKVTWEAWGHLIKWYRYECVEIGERQAFWGLVYRLLILTTTRPT